MGTNLDSNLKLSSNHIADTKMTTTNEEPELPEFNFKNVVQDIKFGLISLFNNSEFSGPITVLLIFFEMILLKFIIANVPYTEIDYSTYMQQIDQIEKGELNYDKIQGDTGPIVYPGGYVFFYSWMKFLTEGMEDLKSGQEFFRYLYLITFLTIILAYFQMQWRLKLKPYFFYILIFSKRLHSIYVLRLFNDCFTTFFMVSTILVLQVSVKLRRMKDNGKFYCFLMNLIAVDLFAIGVSIKMNALLYLPGLLVVLYFLSDENLIKFLFLLFFGIFIETGLNWKFLVASEEIRTSFIKNAFNFKRNFLFKWTINWKFIGEEYFNDKTFHRILILMHFSVLIIFAFRKWMNKRIVGKSLKQLIVFDGLLSFWKDTLNDKNIVLSKFGEIYVFYVMVTSNVIGILFARSLHYQFLCWYSFSVPFLFYTSKLPYYIIVPLAILHEWCWNQYPSNSFSSAILVLILTTLLFLTYQNDDLFKDDVEKKKLV